jgi:hypothetical protein
MSHPITRYTPAQLLYKVPRVVRRRLRAHWRRWRDTQAPTYARAFPSGPLARYLPDVSARIDAAGLAVLAGVTEQYRRGWFDLLGSGWVPVHYGAVFAGVEGHRYGPSVPVVPDAEGRWLPVTPANRAEARRLWGLVDEDYVPIDWQVDFRSGYRWEAATPAQELTYGHLPGVDVKVPWELARMYHLPQLALAFGAALQGRAGLASPETYRRAFCNQVLDFLATNPPRFGINWSTAMLVGIRAANLAVAFDLFQAADARFDPAFEQVLVRSLYEHGRYILDHLEWWDFDERNNHYLANIVGLLFVAAYLPATPETDNWLAFAGHELRREVAYQVHDEGSGFEASTCYHAFSAEMLGWAAALLAALPPVRKAAMARLDPQGLPREAARRALEGFTPDAPIVSPGYLGRLRGMYDFLRDMTWPGHQIVQIGDNDSGRFIKLLPVCHRRTVAEARARYANLSAYEALPDTAPWWDEDLLDYRPTQALLQALVDPEAPAERLETQLLRAWVGPLLASPALAASRTFAAPDTLEAWQARIAALPENRRSRLVLPALPGDLREGLQACCYPEFGLWLFRSPRLWLGIRCGPAQLRGNVGHPHEDQLAVACWLDGTARIIDPGTYTYTALLERRNWYRSEAAHFVPRCEGEGAHPSPAHAAFALPTWHPAVCRAFGPTGFAGLWTRPQGGEVGRMVEVTATGVCITDFSLAACKPGDLQAAYAVQETLPVSAGYGRVLNRMAREG